MNHVATQERVAEQSVPPSSTMPLNELVQPALQQAPLLKMLSAGWATPEDLKVVGPLLARAYGNANPAAPGISRLLDVLAVPLPEEDAEPSFLKYFLLRRAEMIRQESPGTVAGQVNQEIGAQVGAAMHRAMHKTGLIEDDAPPPAESTVAVPAGAAQAAWVVHQKFFAELHAQMRYQRMLPAFERIQARISLEREEEPPIALFPGVGEIMFAEADEKRSIEFTVERYPCTAEVLDPRVVRIPPGKSNNRHKHAHETLFYFVSGTGEILVGEKWVPVKPGDAVFSPRWSIHQTRNTGPGELTLLAITDYYLTSQVYVGKYDKI